MNTTFLLAAASLIVMSSGTASPASAGKVFGYEKPNLNSKLLWNQSGNGSGYYIDSQNFTSGSSQYNNQGADDFVVPQDQEWRITEVVVTGEFVNGSGPATSENIIFYKDKEGKPGAVVKNGTFVNLNGTGGPNFAIVLPGRGIKLKPGTYWVSVIANMDFYAQGLWTWEASTVENGNQAMWQNPKGGFGICPTWDTIENCQGSAGPDFVFKLRGKSRTILIRQKGHLKVE